MQLEWTEAGDWTEHETGALEEELGHEEPGQLECWELGLEVGQGSLGLGQGEEL